MNPPTTSRRSFLRSLALLAAAPLALSRVLGAAKPANPPMRDGLDRSAQPDTPCAYAGRAIKVPSNRIALPVYRYHNGKETVVDVGYLYEGDWDGTFKLEEGCTNPAYVLADLIERDLKATFGSTNDWQWQQHDGPAINWKTLYDFGVWCDELVCDIETESLKPPQHWWDTPDAITWQPRFTVASLGGSPQDAMPNQREYLTMHFKVWHATDPRYRRSFPVYPDEA